MFLLSVSVSAQQPGGNTLQAEAQAQSATALTRLNTYLNEIGYAQLARRAEKVAALKTKADAEQRAADVRKKIIQLVGGLPQPSGPVKVRQIATVKDEGFHIENVAYESAPGYWVTANVYVPDQKGSFPAIVIAPGHGAGKGSQYNWAANFARAGILTLAIDPMGQGERMQHFDPELGTSKIEPSGEHEHANQSALLIGQHIARYWFADGIRGVDYLTQRKDVDAKHIGVFGCSGGGTFASYLGAMDPRISVVAASSYITAFKELLPGNGPQDAEQTLPGFIAAGLDFADWVELVAPRPFAIVAFDEDFFPIAGAKRTYDETKRFYSLYDANDKLIFIDGTGGHCNLGPVTPQVLSFLFKYLKGPDVPVPSFGQYRPTDLDDLTVTTNGQVVSSLASETVESLTRKEAPKIIPVSKAIASPADLARFQSELQKAIRDLAVVAAQPGESLRVTSTTQQSLDGYRLESLSIESEPGVTLDSLIAIPTSGNQIHPAVLWMDALPNPRTAASADFIRLVKAGNIVMAFQPRGVLGEPLPNPNQLALGNYMQPLLRSIAVGKTLVGMRVDDTLRAITWLSSRSDVDKSAITLYGKGGLGMVALHTAALDNRVTRVVIENTLVSYQSALQAGLHKNLSEVVIPGVLRRYDVSDLLIAINPRPVLIVNSASAMGLPVRTQKVSEELWAAFSADDKLGTKDRIKILKRGFRDPLPVD